MTPKTPSGNPKPKRNKKVTPGKALYQRVASITNNLPLDVIIRIVSHLELPEMILAQRVCHRWCKALRESSISNFIESKLTQCGFEQHQTITQNFFPN